MFPRSLAALALPVGLTALAGTAALSTQAQAYEVEHYTVYCADDRIEVSFWDLQQMIVRHGTPVCQFATFTSYSSALTFAQKNFGGEGQSCYCE